MRIAIITRHNIINYGSVLQTLALQHVLERLGHEPFIIDYIRKDEDYRLIARVLVAKNKKWNRNPITRFLFVNGKTIEFIFGGKKFEVIRKKYLHLTKVRYSSLEQLRNMPPSADVYLTGSDQVWGKIGADSYDSAFFLDFGNENVKSVSYAASFGRIDLATEVLKEYQQLLLKYEGITVRENSAKSIIQEMGFSNVKQVLDPTLLLTREQWDSMFANEKRRMIPPAGEYIVVYQRRPNKHIDNYVRELSKRKGIPFYRITADVHQLIRGGELVLLPSMGEFLDWIKKATLLVTDSFHGTAFAINYNVPFVDILPQGTETRNISILELTGLTDRIVEDLNDYSYMDKTVDFTFANQVLKRERKQSLSILEDLIKG